MSNSNRRRSNRRSTFYMNKRVNENDLGDDDDDDDQITTTVGNKIYYYDSISKKNILNLIMELEDMNSKLTKESQLYNFEPYIELHIHSCGGELHAGLSAYDILKKNKIPIYTYIEGEACSAATLLALAGKKRYITENSMILVHQLRTWFSGKHNELEDELKSADKMMNCLMKIYKDNTNLSNKRLEKLIKGEEYLNAQECLENGFVHEIL